MRESRVKLPILDEAVYHCMSRVVGGEALLGPQEKEMLRRMIHQVADFSGVEVLTYAVLDNHFHVLLLVPAWEPVSDEELLRRWEVLYGSSRDASSRLKVLRRQLERGGAAAEAERRGLLSRMGDLSEYMKTLKQRFTRWYNSLHGRYGTLWAERFKSVLVEGEGHALETVAAYIDLNPVRAGLGDDPKDYRFCGYAEAVAGSRKARSGLERVCGRREGLERYRELLFGKAGLPKAGKEGAELSTAQALRCRVRYFTDGAILGSAAFVRGYAQSWRRQRGRKRSVEPRPLQGADWGDLAVIKRLRRSALQ